MTTLHQLPIPSPHPRASHGSTIRTPADHPKNHARAMPAWSELACCRRRAHEARHARIVDRYRRVLHSAKGGCTYEHGIDNRCLLGPPLFFASCFRSRELDGDEPRRVRCDQLCVRVGSACGGSPNTGEFVCCWFLRVVPSAWANAAC